MKIQNRKARFNYEFIEKEIAGIVLAGTEVKSIREGKVSFTDSYCFFVDGELWLKSLHISEYKEGTYNNHEPKRDRKLLLKKQQLRKLQKKVNEGGLTIIPTTIFINSKGLVKIEIALSRGKKTIDKRETIKNRDIEKDTNRELK
jgi:SsrA-binding protein